MIAGEIVLVAPPNKDAAPMTPNNPSYYIILVPRNYPMYVSSTPYVLPITAPKQNRGRKIPLGQGRLRERVVKINLRMQ